MKNHKVKVECSSCDGTGLYSGFAEEKGAAVICKMCEGKAYRVLWYKPFIRRRRKKKIDKVYVESAIWTKEDGRTERKSITPKEFYNDRRYAP